MLRKLRVFSKSHQTPIERDLGFLELSSDPIERHLRICPGLRRAKSAIPILPPVKQDLL